MTPEELTLARIEAARIRREWLDSVKDGITTPEELISFAATENGAPLRSIPLWRVLALDPATGETHAKRHISQIASVSGSNGTPSRFTVGWLIDRRVGGRRLIASAGAKSTHGPPWAGFPFTPKPVSSKGAHQ